ncbi:type II toxin-antitoxin system VapC family toxin [Anatilimnocola floriformis]|uniref:type II toxin-antitoxin system VapC family toxin n=1 Tax=Anatilimnocola floriformis TaxID=2948575 RepID=UPI0020C255C5|nr:type II toxin-antitoxin system VapC family toxin [Anatilimnocola floriformis]
MRIILDTHVFLWFVSGDPRLPTRYRSEIQSPENDIFLSAASIWEAVIKNQLGHLPLPEKASVYLPQQRLMHGIHSLPIDENDMAALSNLPAHHRDPFDRMIIAQAVKHSLVLASLDSQFSAYPVALLPST